MTFMQDTHASPTCLGLFLQEISYAYINFRGAGSFLNPSELYISLAGFLSPNHSETLIVVTQHPQKHVPPGMGEHTELRNPKHS